MAQPTAKKARTEAPTAATLAIRKMRLMTAIKTPYTATGDIDLPAFDRHVAHQVANGVEALIVGGTTGEGHLLSWEDHLMLIGHVKAKFPDLCIVGNTGSNSTAEQTIYTQKGFAAGMDASLIINPYYGKTSKKGVLMHLEAAMEFGPAIIYNVPGRTGQDIPPETIYEIMGHKHFCGVKECMGNDRIKTLADKGIACWSGNDDQCFIGRWEYGCQGVISVTSNIVPGLFKELMHGPRNDDTNKKLEPLYSWLFTEPNPIGVNTMMMQLGCAEPVFRLPYVNRDKAAREEAVKIVKAIGIEHTPGKDIKVLEDSDFKLLATAH